MFCWKFLLIYYLQNDFKINHDFSVCWWINFVWKCFSDGVEVINEKWKNTFNVSVTKFYIWFQFTKNK